MTGTMTPARNILFTMMTVLLGLCCTGCFTYGTIEDLGSTKTYIAGEHFEYSPDQNEIVYSGQLEKEYNYIPFLHIFHVSPKSTVQTYEKRFPMDRLPGNLIRFYLEAEQDPAVERAKKTDSGLMFFREPAEIVRAGTGGEDHASESSADSGGTSGNDGAETSPSPSGSIVSAGDTVRLRVNPDDLHILSGPFVILLSGDSDMRSSLVFPFAENGSRYEMLMSADYLNGRRPFLQDIDGGEDPGTGKSTGFLGWCWKIFWIPNAVVVDGALLPIYPFFWGYSLITHDSIL